jgi:hypothetical protein
MTKTEALHELKVYMHDLRADARREGYTVDRAQVWEQMVEGWQADGQIDAATAKAWIERGAR